MAAGREREHKGRGRLRQPVFEMCDGRQAVEAAVDLDTVKIARIVGEPVAAAQFGRMEAFDPVWVVPAGCADMHAHPFTQIKGSRRTTLRESPA